MGSATALLRILAASAAAPATVGPDEGGEGGGGVGGNMKLNLARILDASEDIEGG